MPAHAPTPTHPVFRPGEAWSPTDRAWLIQREQCRCREPRPGPVYFGQRDCKACGHPIRRA